MKLELRTQLSVPSGEPLEVSPSDVVDELQHAIDEESGFLLIVGDTRDDVSNFLEELFIDASGRFGRNLISALFTPEHALGAMGALEEALEALFDADAFEGGELLPWEIIEASLLRKHVSGERKRLLIVDCFEKLLEECEPDALTFCQTLRRCAHPPGMAVVVGIVRNELDKIRDSSTLRSILPDWAFEPREAPPEEAPNEPIVPEIAVEDTGRVSAPPKQEPVKASTLRLVPDLVNRLDWTVIGLVGALCALAAVWLLVFHSSPSTSQNQPASSEPETRNAVHPLSAPKGLSPEPTLPISGASAMTGILTAGAPLSFCQREDGPTPRLLITQVAQQPLAERRGVYPSQPATPSLPAEKKEGSPVPNSKPIAAPAAPTAKASVPKAAQPGTAIALPARSPVKPLQEALKAAVPQFPPARPRPEMAHPTAPEPASAGHQDAPLKYLLPVAGLPSQASHSTTQSAPKSPDDKIASGNPRTKTPQIETAPVKKAEPPVSATTAAPSKLVPSKEPAKSAGNPKTVSKAPDSAPRVALPIPLPKPAPPVRKDPVQRLVEELGAGKPASFAEVTAVVNRLSPRLSMEDQKELGDYLTGRFFNEEHFTLAMGKLYASDRINDWGAANAWFRQAVDLNVPAAMTELGISYILGRGIPTDPDEGYRWLVRGRMENDGPGAFLAAICRIRGLGAEQNESLARELLNVAIDLHCKEACWESSRLHADGLGGPADSDWALHLCKLGADLGETKCLEQLAAYYEQGEVFPKEPAKAAELRSKIRHGAAESWVRKTATLLAALPPNHPAKSAAVAQPDGISQTPPPSKDTATQAAGKRKSPSQTGSKPEQVTSRRLSYGQAYRRAQQNSPSPR